MAEQATQVLIGVARGEGVVAGLARLDAGGGVHEERGPAWFEVETETGVVVVEVDAAAFLPERELRDQWGDLERQPLASLVRGHAPGPHRKVTIEGAVVSAGDRVAVHGVVLEARFAKGGDGDGYRDAARSVPERVRAVMVGIGANGEAAITAALETRAELARLADAKQRRQRAAQVAAEPRDDRGLVRGDRVSVSTVALMVLVVGGLATLSALVRPPRGTLNFGAVTAGAMALFGWLLASQAQPALHRVEGDDSSKGWTARFTMVLLGSLILAGIAVTNWGQRGKAGRRVELSNVVFWGWCVALIVIAVAAWLSTRRFRVIARTLLSAPVLPREPANQTWGSVSGAVKRRAGDALLPVLDWGIALALHTRATKDGTGKHPWRIKNEKFSTKAGFDIETADTVVACSTEQALWSSVACIERTDKKRKPPSIDSVALIGNDTRVLVAGRYLNGQLASTGPESLLMFASHEPDDPRTVLSRLRRRHWLAMALCFIALPLHVLVGSYARGWW